MPGGLTGHRRAASGDGPQWPVARGVQRKVPRQEDEKSMASQSESRKAAGENSLRAI